MRLVSTAGRAPAADLRTALLAGLAPDGGLYLPETIEPLPAAVLSSLFGAPFDHIALTLARHLLAGELTDLELEGVVRFALDFPVPLVRLKDRIHVLELFHGPTFAFKDVGARFMARLMAVCYRNDDRPLTVLVATSGDTGSAVAHAFLDVPGTRVLVLYPYGKVSPLQERQIATLGGNVTALAVDGTFDDCQRLVKAAFVDDDLKKLRLTSGNSINLGRLLPQIFYYFHAWAQLAESPVELIVSVPSGNFGNLTAGLMAKRVGLPVTRFVAATNANDVVPRFLSTGEFQPRASVATMSSAMDVGYPSNFARMLALYGGDGTGLRADVLGAAWSESHTSQAIQRAYVSWNYVLDPHSAVACLGLGQGMAGRPGATGIFLATAHPAKSAAIVQALIGRAVPMPERLAACLKREPRSRRVGTQFRDLKEILLA